MNKADILYDHYKDSFNKQVMYTNKRNKYFIIVLVLMSILFLQVFESDSVNELLSGLIGEKIGYKAVNFKFIHTVTLFSFLWSMLLYFQANITVAIQYDYIHNLEDQLHEDNVGFDISREGHFYKRQKSTYRSFVRKIYNYGFPGFIVSTILLNFATDMSSIVKVDFLIVMNVIIYSSIVILVALYVKWIIFKK